jgi:hypothetical protein
MTSLRELNDLASEFHEEQAERVTQFYERAAGLMLGRKPWSWTTLPGWPGGHGLVHLRFSAGLIRRCTVYVDAPACDLLHRWLTSERREYRR